jgi:predicted glycosyltransferase
VWFLTSSEADGLVFAEGFPAFKIPSKTIVRESGVDRTTYLALAKQWVWHTLALLRPDLFIVDTFPRGSFGELLGVLDLCRRSAFVYRPVRDEVAARPDFQAMLSLYDLLLVPEVDATVRTPPDTGDRLVQVGPVLSRERWELFARERARDELGIEPNQKCVFVSAGGGGDREARAQLEHAVRALSADPELALVLGTGPLYRGRPFPRTTALSGSAAEWSLAFDAAVCASGYNTFGELMFAGVPAVFVPQSKLADDQRARAQLAMDRGAATLWQPSSEPAALHRVVRDLLARPDAREAARALVPENCARVAAAELLRLLFPPASVDRAEDALDDDRLAHAWALGRELDVLTLAPRLARGCDDQLGDAVLRACQLLEGRDARELRAWVDVVARGLPSSSVVQRAETCRQLLPLLDPILPGDAAAARAIIAEGGWGSAASSDAALLARGVCQRRGAVATE